MFFSGVCVVMYIRAELHVTRPGTPLEIMNAYQDLVHTVLMRGQHRQNRTEFDTVSTFSPQYKIDVGPDNFPLLTTKKMDTYRWDSLREELAWFLSGTHHTRDLDTNIWDAWADDKGDLETAYGRFWRRYPVPDSHARLPGEAWADEDSPYVTVETRADGSEVVVFDQLAHHVDVLNGDHPEKSPNSRRLVVPAWHPANANVSGLPPCHAFWGLNVQGDTLNLHLTQRSGDIALGVPFNIASYSALLIYIAQLTGFNVGQFSHSITDAHIYCGAGERGQWYADNLDELKDRLWDASQSAAVGADDDAYREIREWILANAPADEHADDPEAHEYGADHIPGLLEQLARRPYDRPSIEIADASLDELTMDNIELQDDYESHGGLGFIVAE